MKNTEVMMTHLIVPNDEMTLVEFKKHVNALPDTDDGWAIMVSIDKSRINGNLGVRFASTKPDPDPELY